MKQRKLWALLLAAALLAVFTGCGAARETSPASTTAQGAGTRASTVPVTTDHSVTPETTAARETEAATTESSWEAPETSAPQPAEQPSAEPTGEAPVTTAPQPTEPEPTESQRVETTTERNAEKMLQMKIGGTAVRVNWENNRSVEALKALCENGPLVIQMSMYGGFEQVGPIGSRLPSDDLQTTTAAGDIVLYSSNQIVVFYGSNSWAYTRLGHITDRDAAGMAALLGKGNVTITISMEDVG